MRWLQLLFGLILSLVLMSCGGGNGSSTSTSGSTSTVPVNPTGYTLLAWSELGMHCIDGKDYSIASVLPPFNSVHAQLIKVGEPPQILTSTVTLTYEAVADTTGSTNTISSTKTNFWTYTRRVVHTAVPPDAGTRYWADGKPGAERYTAPT